LEVEIGFEILSGTTQQSFLFNSREKCGKEIPSHSHHLDLKHTCKDLQSRTITLKYQKSRQYLPHWQLSKSWMNP